MIEVTSYQLEDAHSGDSQEVSVSVDQHGVVLKLAGIEQLVVCDLAAGQLRVYIAESEDADTGDPVAAIHLDSVVMSQSSGFSRHESVVMSQSS